DTPMTEPPAKSSLPPALPPAPAGAAMTNARILPITAIALDAEQPRKAGKPKRQEALVESVRRHGIVQPIVVCPGEEGKYRVVVGERRFRAAQAAGLREI